EAANEPPASRQFVAARKRYLPNRCKNVTDCAEGYMSDGRDSRVNREIVCESIEFGPRSSYRQYDLRPDGLPKAELKCHSLATKIAFFLLVHLSASVHRVDVPTQRS